MQGVAQDLTERFTLMMTSEMLLQIAKYVKKKQYPNFSMAIRELIKIGLRKEGA